MPAVLILISLLLISSQAECFLAGGRPNAVSGGNNAFAGISNPANAVSIPNRWDVGAYYLNQQSNINNLDNNPQFLPGKTNTAYKKNNLLSFDAAITHQFKFNLASKPWEASISLAAYSAPNRVAYGTKKPVPISGTTPQVLTKDTQIISGIFSFKVNKSHSLGVSLDYFYLSYNRQGYQNVDTPKRSVSPGNVTNNGTDHSGGLGISLGWHWKISPNVEFGLAWIKKSYVGQFKRYQGFEPHRAKNYIPQSFGAGIGYRLTSKIAGRLEALWINYSALPGANLSVLPDGQLNKNKRGSNESPGPGLQNATLVNMGLGYQFNPKLSIGAGFSHRLKRAKDDRIILAHPYKIQTIYDLLTLGANYKYKKQEFYLILTKGFKNRVKGRMPDEIGGGRFITEKSTYSASLTWGYLY